MQNHIYLRYQHCCPSSKHNAGARKSTTAPRNAFHATKPLCKVYSRGLIRDYQPLSSPHVALSKPHGYVCSREKLAVRVTTADNIAATAMVSCRRCFVEEIAAMISKDPDYQVYHQAVLQGDTRTHPKIRKQMLCIPWHLSQFEAVLIWSAMGW